MPEYMGEVCNTKEQAINLSKKYLSGEYSHWNTFAEFEDRDLALQNCLVVDATRAAAYATLATVLPSASSLFDEHGQRKGN